MKHLQLVLAALSLSLFTTPLIAQTPNAINYQAIARDAAGDIMMNQVINVSFVIHSGSAAGPIVYAEDHAATSTNQFGLFSVAIGNGTPVAGTLSGINWSANSHWLEVKVNGSVVGSQQLSTVPYSFLARDVENDNVDDADNDAANELQTISLSGSIVTLSDGGGSVSVDDADANATNELQTIAKAGSTVTLSNGGGSFIDDVDDADASPTNELQTLGISGSNLTISSGNTVALPSSGTPSLIRDADNDTKIQTEESADEDIIRFDLAGNERWVMTGTRLEPVNTGNSVFIGVGAGANDDLTTNNNVFVGHQAGYSNLTGFSNTASGYNALYFNNTGYWNTASGRDALFSNTTGYNNTASGYNALFSNTTGSFNTANGVNALYSNTTGISNTASGYGALFSNTTGYWNTASGYCALFSNTTGYNNTASGYNALLSNATGSENTANGHSALYYNKAGSYGTAIGTRAMYYANSSATAFTNYNVAVGYEALSGSSTHSANTGNYNTALGYQSLLSNSTGYNNTASGYTALYSNTSGSSNTASGFTALYSNTTGNYNTASGYNALLSNTTGNYNTASGRGALYSNTTGYNNTASGYNALYSNTSGYERTAVGHSANSVGIAYNNSTGLGYNADVTASNQVRLGNSSVTSIGGQVGWTTLSDGTFKQNVSEDVSGLDFITKLRPVTYNLDLHAIDDFFAEHYGERDSSDYEGRYDKENIRYSGFVAQEVEVAAQEVGYDFSGVDAPKNEDDFYGLRYAQFVVPLVKAVQEQQAMIQELQRQNLQLQERVKELGQR